MTERHKCFLLVWKGVCRFCCKYRKSAEKLRPWAGRDFPTRTQCTAGRCKPHFFFFYFISLWVTAWIWSHGFLIFFFIFFFYYFRHLFLFSVEAANAASFFCQLKHLWAAIFGKELLSWQNQKSRLRHFFSVVSNRRGSSWLLRVGLLWSPLSRGYGRV